MKRILQKALVDPPKPIVVQIDPREKKTKLVIPKIEYRYVASAAPEPVFEGEVVAVPKSLIFFLTHAELMVVVTIMERTNEQGYCPASIMEFSKMLGLTPATVSVTLYSLRKLGILLEESNGKRGAGRVRKINYKALQRLNDLLEGESHGMYPLIRKACRKQTIFTITKEDIIHQGY